MYVYELNVKLFQRKRSSSSNREGQTIFKNNYKHCSIVLIPYLQVFFKKLFLKI